MSMDVRKNQAKIAEVVKLKKAAILQLEKGLGPAEALQAADLPADVKGRSNWANKLRKMRGHLHDHLGEWATDSWAGRSSPSSPSTSRASSPTPGSSAAAAAAATPKLFLPLPAQNLAYVKELEQKVKDLEREKDRVARAARKKVNRRDKEVDKQKGLLSKEREQHAHTRDVEILLVDNAANMAAFWGHAVTQATALHSDAVKLAAYHQINSGFHLELNLHTTPRKNHIVGISEGMVALTGNACATVAKELLIMHRRQSKDLINWRPSMSERRLYHFVLATNAELESLLGTVDGATRDKRTQSTYATGAYVFLFAFCASRV